MLIIPTTPPPPPKIKLPEPPKIQPPEPPKIQFKMEQPKIVMPKPEPKPEPKPIQMEAKLNMPVIKAAKPAVILAPQPKAAMTAAMPAQNNLAKASTAPVHLGETFGVTPNPNATGPATVAAIGNPYGGMQGPAVAPHGVVGSTGIGNGLEAGSNRRRCRQGGPGRRSRRHRHGNHRGCVVWWAGRLCGHSQGSGDSPHTAGGRGSHHHQH